MFLILDTTIRLKYGTTIRRLSFYPIQEERDHIKRLRIYFTTSKPNDLQTYEDIYLECNVSRRWILFIMTKQNILRFQITMDYSLSKEGFHCPSDLL